MVLQEKFIEKHRIGIINDPSCGCVNEIQDLEHIFWQCSQHDSQHHIFIKELQKSKFQLPLSTKIVLPNLSIRLCERIESYLENCNIKS